MAGASDKARFYLEKTVPELREWERRGIFTRAEISAIASKRSNFEHILSARGSTSADYARYVDYEMSLDSLRRKRTKRKGLKTTEHTGQRRIFFIFERGTKKFHGDTDFWMQYISYARKQKANKKLSRILTDVLRLHPTKPEMWAYAAHYAMDVQADVTAARSCVQRGLRFCRNAKMLYLEYARLEMTYIAKIAARRRILGLKTEETEKLERPSESAKQEDNDHEADVISLPNVSAADFQAGEKKNILLDDTSISKLSDTPLMAGDIPIAIFDAAMYQFSNDDSLGAQFFELIAGFSQVSSSARILQHIVDVLISANPISPYGRACQCRLPLLLVQSDSPDLISALMQSRSLIKAAQSELSLPRSKQQFGQQLSAWLSTLLEEIPPVPELEAVISGMILRLNESAEAAGT